MNPDLYAAWLTAGNNLQPIGAWAAGHWTGLVSLAVAVGLLWVVWWAIHDDDRARNDQVATRRATRSEERPEPAEPGTNEDDLLTCLNILAATDKARKGDTHG